MNTLQMLTVHTVLVCLVMSSVLSKLFPSTFNRLVIIILYCIIFIVSFLPVFKLCFHIIHYINTARTFQNYVFTSVILLFRLCFNNTYCYYVYIQSFVTVVFLWVLEVNVILYLGAASVLI